MNHQIHAREVRLIGEDGQQVGVVSLNEALVKAQEAGLDLVEISPNTVPPVCRIMDYGKYLFEQSKRLKKKSKQIQTKELKMRPTTDIADYKVKIRKATEFLEEGSKVKITIRFRGREMAHQVLGREIIERVIRDLQEVGSVEQLPKLEGRQLTTVINPIKH
jgi:translation initiation factor IF-3